MKTKQREEKKKGSLRNEEAIKAQYMQRGWVLWGNYLQKVHLNVWKDLQRNTEAFFFLWKIIALCVASKS